MIVMAVPVALLRLTANNDMPAGFRSGPKCHSPMTRRHHEIQPERDVQDELK